LSFKNEVENEKQKVRLLIRILFGTFLVIIVQAMATSDLQKDFTLHIPPDLRSGVTMNLEEIPASEVYLFSQYILQQLNNWENNGAVDYPNKVNQLSAFLTPRYQQTLKSQIKNRPNGELRDRVRLFKPMPGAAFEDKYVELVGNAWIVWLDVNINETVLGQPVKNMTLRYPIRVVRYDTDREKNPWQLALDGHGGYKPQRIKNDIAGIK